LEFRDFGRSQSPSAVLFLLQRHTPDHHKPFFPPPPREKFLLIPPLITFRKRLFQQQSLFFYPSLSPTRFFHPPPFPPRLPPPDKMAAKGSHINPFLPGTFILANHSWKGPLSSAQAFLMEASLPDLTISASPLSMKVFFFKASPVSPGGLF